MARLLSLHVRFNCMHGSRRPLASPPPGQIVRWPHRRPAGSRWTVALLQGCRLTAGLTPCPEPPCCRQQIWWLRLLEQKGWELKQPMENDHGILWQLQQAPEGSTGQKEP